MLASEQDRPDVARNRARWKAHQGKIDPRRPVFIDETWAKTNMAPLQGWAPKGQRLLAKALFGHWKTMTFLAPLRHDRIDAPWVFDGPIKGEAFGVYVERDWFRPWPKAKSSCGTNWAATRARPHAPPSAPPGRLLLLPPYLPDLNPIERVFAKLKHPLRKAADRTVPATWKRIGALLTKFSPDECANYLVNSGYASA